MCFFNFLCRPAHSEAGTEATLRLPRAPPTPPAHHSHPPVPFLLEGRFSPQEKKNVLEDGWQPWEEGRGRTEDITETQAKREDI